MPKQGVVFPQDTRGQRSTTRTGKEIVSQALAGVDAATAKAVSAEANWRKNYRQYFEKMTALGVASADSSLEIARAGLKAVYSLMQFERDGQVLSLDDALATHTQSGFVTATISGDQEPRPLTVSYKNQQLAGAILRGQMAQWQERGVVEPSHRAGVLRVLDNPTWANDLPAVVLLGAAAEMGPVSTLLNLGATVIAIDLDRPEVWQGLIEKARGSAGTLMFPVRDPGPENATDAELAQRAGADLITDAPEIANWLVGLERPMALGAYAYLDGGDFVRVSVAMDMIVAAVTERSRCPVHPAFLLTPTDVYAVTSEVADSAQASYENPTPLRPLRQLIGKLSGGRFFAPSLRATINGQDGKRYGIINSLVTRQGPNYTLAKRIQRWRSVVAREQGQVVSCNVAPATYTRSVTKNKVFAAGYAGSEAFGAEMFEPEASNALMTAQLIDDLMSDQSAAHPAYPLANPEELFMAGANHSGIWTMANQLGSLIEAAFIVGMVKRWLPGRRA